VRDSKRERERERERERKREKEKERERAGGERKKERERSATACTMVVLRSTDGSRFYCTSNLHSNAADGLLPIQFANNNASIIDPLKRHVDLRFDLRFRVCLIES
jgi:hypothetical protein